MQLPSLYDSWKNTGKLQSLFCLQPTCFILIFFLFPNGSVFILIYFTLFSSITACCSAFHYVSFSIYYYCEVIYTLRSDLLKFQVSRAAFGNMVYEAVMAYEYYLCCQQIFTLKKQYRWHAAVLISNNCISNHLLISIIIILFAKHCEIPYWKSQQKCKAFINQDLITTQNMNYSPFYLLSLSSENSLKVLVSKNRVDKKKN